MEEKIKQRISELQREIQMHQNRANQAQEILNAETTQIVAKQGAILELQKLLKEEPKQKTEKIEQAKIVKSKKK